MFQLVCVGGGRKGDVYSVGEGGLTVGRESGCEIVLADPLVSRRHCRIYVTDEGLWVEDLGSRNLTLVNGVPTRKQQLKPGDQISVGGRRYIVGESAPPTDDGEDEQEQEQKQEHELVTPRTWSWSEVRPLALDSDRVSPPRQLRPKTIEDLMALYNVAYDFASAMDTDELLTALCKHLEHRLNPERFWVGRLANGEEMVPYPIKHIRAGDWGGLPTSVIRQAVAQKRALLVPSSKRPDAKKGLATTLVAPILAGGQSCGFVALQTETPRGVYDEGDLEFLVLLVRQLAPALSAVEGYEQLKRDNERLRARTGEVRDLVGDSPEIREVRRRIEMAARSELSVLISGETGTGKDLCAGRLHAASKRSSGPWIAVNCAAIPRELFESEVFGYEKGAFTGAAERHEGLMAQANGGTFFLDEVADLSMENQARILRCAEDGTFRPLGAKKEVRVDVRIVAASNRLLKTAVEEGKFRQDLYHRLAGFEIAIPPLRERKQDISVLAEFFFEECRRVAERRVNGLSPEALEALNAYSWPGNVRELRFCILRAVTVAQTEWVRPEDLGLSAAPIVKGTSPSVLVSFVEAEKRHLKEVMEACDGDVERAARILGVGRSTLYRKIAEFRLQP